MLDLSNRSFVSLIEKSVSSSPINSIVNFHQNFLHSFKPQEEVIVNGPYLLNYTNIDKRILDSNFCYNFGETESENLNCFERANLSYKAVKHFYPESNPCFTYLTQRHFSVHGVVLLTHNDEMYGLDSTNNLFGPANLFDGKLKFDRKRLHKFEGENNKIRKYVHNFTDISYLSDSNLSHLDSRLKSSQGLVDFLYSSGQMVASIGDGAHFHFLFMYIDDNLEKIVADLGVNEMGQKRKLLMRFTTDVKTGNVDASLNTYSQLFWHSNIGEKPFEKDLEVQSSVKGDLFRTQIKDAFEFFKDTNLNFDIPRLEDNMFSVMMTHRDMHEAEKYGDDFLNYYYGFIKTQNFNPVSTLKDLRDSGFYERNKEERTLEELTTEADMLGQTLFQEVQSRHRLNLFRLACDAKRYTDLTRERILEFYL